jgi:DNA mismatch repair protein MutL
VVNVLGRDIARQMLPICESPELKEGEIHVSGFAGRPQLTRANRNAQLFFVNGRVIKNRALQHAVQAAYEGLVHGRDRFPLAVVFLQMAPGSVDVNVHPTKSEVRFAREWEVHHAVRVALRETLIASQLAPDWSLGGDAAPCADGTKQLAWCDKHSTTAIEYSFPGAAVQFALCQRFWWLPSAGRAARWRLRSLSSSSGSLQHQCAKLGAQGAFSEFVPPPVPEDERKISLRPLGQISNNAYILCEGDDGLYIVCQHRAHERILADKAIAAAEGRPVESQRWLFPTPTDAGPRALAAIEENAALLKDLGFEIEAFGGSSVWCAPCPL